MMLPQRMKIPQRNLKHSVHNINTKDILKKKKKKKQKKKKEHV